MGANELGPDQLRAFRQILGSTDFITLFRGGAGTGKSSCCVSFRKRYGFDREFQGCPRGSKGALVAVTPAGLAVEVEGRIKRVPKKFFDRVTVCRPAPLTICSSDRLQLKANAQTQYEKAKRADRCLSVESGVGRRFK